MGGGIAMDFYAHYPEKVATLTICDSLPGFTNLTPAQRAEWIRLRQEPLLAGKEPKDIAPTVARTVISKSAPAIFDRMVASISQLHKQSYLKTITAIANFAGPSNSRRFASRRISCAATRMRLRRPRFRARWRGGFREPVSR
jgi:pimeloyl-ACP methyl ester carboxylesterase